MMTAALLPRRPRTSRVGIATIAAVLLVASVRPAQAQTAAELYARAQTDQQQLGDRATAEAARRVARSYEAIVRQFPASAYCDNALWDAALLLEQTWQRYGQRKDRDDAVRVFTWLSRSYPGALARQSTAHVATLTTQAAPPAAAAMTSSTEQQAPGPRDTVASDPAPQAPGGSTRPAPSTTLKGITRSTLPRGDRIIVELTDEAPYHSDRVANPDRVFFDFANATVAPAVADQLKHVSTSLIKTVRVGSPTKGVTRVVMELNGSPRHSAFLLYNPFRLVIDVEGTSVPPPPAPTPATTPVASPPGPAPNVKLTSPPVPIATPRPTPTPATTPAATRSVKAAAETIPVDPTPSPLAPSSTGKGDYSLARQLGLRVAKIVIDPGHGGHDPGAIANGVTEADLVLDIALRLAALLQQTPGVEVVLTRRTNEFIPLEERTAIANREHADLFLSIHANSHRQAAVSGIETYFLNFATNPEAEAVAARENAASVQTMGTLPTILKTIAMNNKLEESRELAIQLQASLTRKSRSQAGVTRNLGVKQAPFVVLIGAQMPSVLTEVAFLTNKTDAALLKQPAYRQQVAQALRDALVKYQDSLKRAGNPVAQTRKD
jgi:N-acetylmuramoyl-L-alanine amidase